jgi:hypothetical protein
MLGRLRQLVLLIQRVPTSTRPRLLIQWTSKSPAPEVPSPIGAKAAFGSQRLQREFCMGKCGILAQSKRFGRSVTKRSSTTKTQQLFLSNREFQILIITSLWISSVLSWMSTRAGLLEEFEICSALAGLPPLTTSNMKYPPLRAELQSTENTILWFSLSLATYRPKAGSQAKCLPSAMSPSFELPWGYDVGATVRVLDSLIPRRRA